MSIEINPAVALRMQQEADKATAEGYVLVPDALCSLVREATRNDTGNIWRSRCFWTAPSDPQLWATPGLVLEVQQVADRKAAIVVAALEAEGDEKIREQILLALDADVVAEYIGMADMRRAYRFQSRLLQYLSWDRETWSKPCPEWDAIRDAMDQEEVRARR